MSQTSQSYSLTDYLQLNMENGTLLAPSIQRVDITNTDTGNFPATRRVIMGAIGDANTGYLDLHDTNGLHRSSPLTILQNEANAGENAGWLSMGVPDAGTSPNGLWFRAYGDGGRIRPQIVSNSNYGETNTSDCGLEIVSYVTEKSSGTASGFVFDVRGLPPSNVDFYPFGATAFSNSKSYLLSISNNTAPAWFVRTSGDVHSKGAEYKNSTSFSSSFTMALGVHTHYYTGSTGNTITLPDPTITDNVDREHMIVNIGTGNIALSQLVYLDGTTSISTLSFTHPDNKLKIKCFNNKWYAIV